MVHSSYALQKIHSSGAKWFGLNILMIATFCVHSIGGSEAEERLLIDLFKNYNKDARPAVYDDDAVNVKFGLTLSQIIDVHEKSQILVISAWIRQL